MLASVDVVSVLLALCVFQQHVTESSATSRKRRSVMAKEEKYRWPNKELLYAFNTTNEGLISGIEIVTAEIAARTCIKFKQVDRDSEKHKVVIGEIQGQCYSEVGYSPEDYTNNEQPLRIDTQMCLMLDALRHEVQHALGVIHQQSAFDRDEHIRLLTDKISPEELAQFEKIPENMTSYFGTEYDFKSSMHYASSTAFSNGTEAMIARDPEKHTMIQHRNNPRLSFYDLMSLNNAYKCGEKCRGECDGYFDKHCSCIKPDNILFGGTVDNPKWPPKHPPKYKAPASFEGIYGVLNGTFSASRVRSSLPGQYYQPNAGKSFKKRKGDFRVYYVEERDEFIVPLSSNKVPEGLFLGNRYFFPGMVADLKRTQGRYIHDNYGRAWLLVYMPDFAIKKLVPSKTKLSFKQKMKDLELSFKEMIKKKSHQPK